MTQTLEQTALPDTELLHVLLAWCYYHQDALKFHFCEYARNTHSQPSTVYNYEKPHRTYSVISNSRVEYAINLILEGGVGCITLPAGNEWYTGQQLKVIGFEEKEYTTSFSFLRDKPGKVWLGADCGCADFQPMRPCKHAITAWMMGFAFNMSFKNRTM